MLLNTNSDFDCDCDSVPKKVKLQLDSIFCIMIYDTSKPSVPACLTVMTEEAVFFHSADCHNPAV